jgi:hypothetical protein
LGADGIFHLNVALRDCLFFPTFFCQANKFTFTPATGEFKMNEGLKDDLQEGYETKDAEGNYLNSLAEPLFMDYGGAWQFPLDFLPFNSQIRVFASPWNEKKKTCNPRTGKDSEEKCQIDAMVS